MTEGCSDADSTPVPGANFRTTHWSVVLEAGAGTDQGGEALEALCRLYWFPLFAFVRRRGFTVVEAEDLTQEFFARLLSGEVLAAASPDRGRFRSFLLAALKNFLANEWDRSTRIKRGRDFQFIKLDALDPEERGEIEPAGSGADESAFDREWAEALVRDVLARLRAEVVRDAGPKRFEALKPFLVMDAPARYMDIAAQLGLSEAAVKSAIHRLRRRYGELIRAAVADTVHSSADIEDEIRHLFAALAP